MAEAPILNASKDEADLAEWQRPTLMKLSLEDTMVIKGGSNTDGFGGTFA